jgi:hypothetical protein
MSEKGLKIWLDDIRPIPLGYDIWAKSAYECIGLIISGNVTEISFDHDLGLLGDEDEDENNTGYKVATFIEEWAFNYAHSLTETELKRIKWDVHSANPSGKINIESAMKQADKFWDMAENK